MKARSYCRLSPAQRCGVMADAGWRRLWRTNKCSSIGLSDPPISRMMRGSVSRTTSAKSLIGDKNVMRRALQFGRQPEVSISTSRRSANRLASVASRVLGCTLQPRHIFQMTNNGVAVELSNAEATQVATLTGATTVRHERMERVLTDAGPQWIGAAQGVERSSRRRCSRRKGDGGCGYRRRRRRALNPTHPPFAATDGSGYNNVNSRGHFLRTAHDGRSDAQCPSSSYIR